MLDVAKLSAHRAEVAAALKEERELMHATEAYVDMIRARKLIHRLQREAVLGRADDDALDAAVMAYRQARAEAARWMPPEDPGGLKPEELFASWLFEAALRRDLRLAAYPPAA